MLSQTLENVVINLYENANVKSCVPMRVCTRYAVPDLCRA